MSKTFEDIFTQVSRLSGYWELTFAWTTERHKLIKELINNYDKRIATQTKAQRTKDTTNFYLKDWVWEYDIPSWTSMINDMYVLSDWTKYYLEEVPETTWNQLEQFQDDFDDWVSIDATWASLDFADATTSEIAQSFVPTDPNIKWVSLKLWYDAQFSWTVTVELQADDWSWDPSWTALATYTIANDDIKQDPDWDNWRFVPLKYVVWDKSWISYWIVLTSSTSDATDKPYAVYNSSSSQYADWALKAYTWSWAAVWSWLDMSLKVHFWSWDTDLPQFYNISWDKIRISPTPDTANMVMVDRFKEAWSMSAASDTPSVKAGWEELLEFWPTSDIYLSRRQNATLAKQYKDKYTNLFDDYKDEIAFPTNDRVVKYNNNIWPYNPNLNPTVTAT